MNYCIINSKTIFGLIETQTYRVISSIVLYTHRHTLVTYVNGNKQSIFVSYEKLSVLVVRI